MPTIKQLHTPAGASAAGQSDNHQQGWNQAADKVAEEIRNSPDHGWAAAFARAAPAQSSGDELATEGNAGWDNAFERVKG